MKWFTDFFGKKNETPVLVSNPLANRQAELAEWNDELFNLCWDREALLVEIETAKRQKKKRSHLIAALVVNQNRRLILEIDRQLKARPTHNGKNGQ